MLLRSISKDARSYCLLHATGDSYQELRKAAMRHETQQRMFAEMGLHDRTERPINEVGDATGDWWWEDDEWDDSISAVGAGKCRRCGKTGHFEKDCKTDLSKTECFKCGETGHIGARCPQAKTAKAYSDSGSQSGKATEATGRGKGKGGQKGRGTSKGKGSKGRGRGGKGGKKGKMHEITEEEPAEEWHEEEEEGEGEDDAQASSLLIMPLFFDVENVSESNVEFSTMCDALMVSQVATDDSWSWWLLDSGASVTVMSAQYETQYTFSELGEVTQKGGFAAANGSPVKMTKRGCAKVSFEIFKSRESDEKRVHSVSLKCFVGNTKHNILSVPQLMENGWDIHFTSSGCYLEHHSGVVIGEIAWHCGCPWLKAVVPSKGADASQSSVSKVFPQS